MISKSFISILLTHALLLHIVVFCQFQNITESFLDFQDSRAAFLRSYSLENKIVGFHSFDGNIIYFSSGLGTMYSNPQTYKLFWNNNGLQGASSFCMYDLAQGVLIIRVVYDTNTSKLDSKDYQLNGILTLLQSSVIINDYWFFVSLASESSSLESENNADINSSSSSSSHFRFIYISQNLSILNLDIYQQIDYSYANFYAIQSCVYEITVSQGGQLQSNKILCMSDYGDVLAEIQYVGDDNLIISGMIYQLRLFNGVIMYLQPVTSAIILQNPQLPYYQSCQIVDLASLGFDISNFMYNSAFILQESTMLITAGLLNSSHNQQYQFINLLSFGDPNDIKQTPVIQPTGDQQIFLSLYENDDIWILQHSSDVDSFVYFLYDYHNTYIRLLSRNYYTQWFLSFYFLIGVSFFFGILFQCLIFRRKRHRGILEKQLHVLLFEKQPEMTKNLFNLKYKLLNEEPLGSGGFGDVFKAVNLHKNIVKNPVILEKMPQFFACKQLFFSEGESAEKDRQSALNEISILNKLKHFPNVIQMYNYFCDNRQAVIAFKLAEKNLSKIILEKRSESRFFSEQEIKQFLSDIYQTLAKIFIEHSIAHRDIKPDNILFAEGKYYISDFGCAKEINMKELQDNNLVLGTMKWMSPEMRNAYIHENIQSKEISFDYFKSDVFSLGLVLLHMLLLGDIAQVNADEDNKSQKLNILSYNRTDLNPKIIVLLSKMLETNPIKRPDARVLYKTIEDICHPTQLEQYENMVSHLNNPQSDLDNGDQQQDLTVSP